MRDLMRLVVFVSTPLLSPEKEREKVGQVLNVVFVEGMVKQNNRYLFYYGGADKHVGVAETTIENQ